jgi:hypothetical protein
MPSKVRANSFKTNESDPHEASHFFMTGLPVSSAATGDGRHREIRRWPRFSPLLPETGERIETRVTHRKQTTATHATRNWNGGSPERTHNPQSTETRRSVVSLLAFLIDTVAIRNALKSNRANLETISNRHCSGAPISAESSLFALLHSRESSASPLTNHESPITNCEPQATTSPSRGNVASSGNSYLARGIFSFRFDRAPDSAAAPKCVARREMLSRVAAWRSLFTETAHRADKRRTRMRVRPDCCPCPHAHFVARSRCGARGIDGHKRSSDAATSVGHGKASVASRDPHHDSRMDFRSSPLSTPGRRISFPGSAGFPGRLPVRRNGRRPPARQAQSSPPAKTCAVSAPLRASVHKFMCAGNSHRLALASAEFRWYPRGHRVRGNR